MHVPNDPGAFGSQQLSEQPSLLPVPRSWRAQNLGATDGIRADKADFDRNSLILDDTTRTLLNAALDLINFRLEFPSEASSVHEFEGSQGFTSVISSDSAWPYRLSNLHPVKCMFDAVDTRSKSDLRASGNPGKAVSAVVRDQRPFFNQVAQSKAEESELDSLDNDQLGRMQTDLVTSSCRSVPRLDISKVDSISVKQNWKNHKETKNADSRGGGLRKTFHLMDGVGKRDDALESYAAVAERNLDLELGVRDRLDLSQKEFAAPEIHKLKNKALVPKIVLSAMQKESSDKCRQLFSKENSGTKSEGNRISGKHTNSLPHKLSEQQPEGSPFLVWNTVWSHFHEILTSCR
jgi:hypothetical protein